MNELEIKVNGQVKSRTKELTKEMGVCGTDYEKGFLWDRCKTRAM